MRERAQALAWADFRSLQRGEKSLVRALLSGRGVVAPQLRRVIAANGMREIEVFVRRRFFR